jgi:hypothetical protein
VKCTVFGLHSSLVSELAPGQQRDLVALPHHIMHGDRNTGVRDVGNRVDLAVVEPIADDLGAHIGLHLMVGADDLDRLAEHGGTEFLHRHARRFHRARPAVVAPPTREVGEHADPHHIVGNLR